MEDQHHFWQLKLTQQQVSNFFSTPLLQLQRTYLCVIPLPRLQMECKVWNSGCNQKKKPAQGQGIFQETEHPPSSCTWTLAEAPGGCARISKGCFSLEITIGMFSLHQRSSFPLGVHEQVDHQLHFAHRGQDSPSSKLGWGGQRVSSTHAALLHNNSLLSINWLISFCYKSTNIFIINQ